MLGRVISIVLLLKMSVIVKLDVDSWILPEISPPTESIELREPPPPPPPPEIETALNILGVVEGNSAFPVDSNLIAG